MARRGMRRQLRQQPTGQKHMMIEKAQRDAGLGGADAEVWYGYSVVSGGEGGGLGAVGFWPHAVKRGRGAETEQKVCCVW